MAQSLELIRAGLAGLAASDPEQADRSTLGAGCEQLLDLAGRLQKQVARRLARFGALGGPAADGMSSSAAWLGHYGRLRPWEARQLATVASRLHLLGETVTIAARIEPRGVRRARPVA